MRGTSVVGVSIWDSHNRCITIHGTDYLVVRDCIGYHSIDIDLPSGCVVNSVNAQHHNADCKINFQQAGSIPAPTTGN